MANSAFSPTLTITGGVSSQGELNIITNPIAQTDTSGWTTSNATLSRVATGSPLDPEIPTGFQAISTTTSSSYVSTTLQLIAPSLRNRKLKLQFFLSLTDSTSWKVDVFKSNNSTRYPLSTDASGVSVIPALTGTYTTTFDMDTDTGVYVRFTRHAGAGSTTLNFTNLIVGPGIQPQGAAVGSEINYGTISIVSSGGGAVKGTASVDRFIGTRNGQYLDVRLNYQQTAAGSAGTGYYQISVPTGFTIDLSQLLTDTIVGSARLLVSPSTNYTADVMVISSTRVYLRVYNDTTNGDWGASVVPLSTTAFTMSAAFSIPIAEWSGSGTVQLAQNDVEWAANDGTNNVYGPAGTAIPTTSTGAITRSITFQTPIQSTDIITVEYTPSVGGQWLSNVTSERGGAAPNWSTYSSASEVGWGEVRQVSSTQVTVVWRRYKLSTTNWGGSADGYWRVRKSSAGAAVGFGIVAPGVSSGLVSASGLPGVTSAPVIPVGYVGEYRSASPGATVAFGAAGASVNVVSITLPPGNYLLSGMLRVTMGSGTFTAYYVGISTSASSFDSLTYVAGAGASITANTYISLTPRYVNISASTTYYVVSQLNYTVLPTGNYGTESIIQAVRIA